MNIQMLGPEYSNDKLIATISKVAFENNIRPGIYFSIYFLPQLTD